MRVCVINRDLGDLAWVGGYAKRVALGFTVLVLQIGLDGGALVDLLQQVLTREELRALLTCRGDVFSQSA